MNVTKSTLLLELERFEGVLVIASNFQQNYDAAFRRRITHHIPFELPDDEALEQLWALHLVTGIPLDENRTKLISRLVAASRFGDDPDLRLSGADVLLAMRLALPASVNESPTAPRIAFHHFERAIARIRRAKEQVARPAKPRSWTEPVSVDELPMQVGRG